jgi:hypothetical protein
MEMKDQLNQNPEEVNKPSQEENSESVEKTDTKTKKEKQKPVEDQEKNTAEKKTGRKVAKPKAKKVAKSSTTKKAANKTAKPEEKEIAVTDKESLEGTELKTTPKKQKNSKKDKDTSTSKKTTSKKASTRKKESVPDESESADEKPDKPEAKETAVTDEESLEGTELKTTSKEQKDSKEDKDTSASKKTTSKKASAKKKKSVPDESESSDEKPKDHEQELESADVKDDHSEEAENEGHDEEHDTEEEIDFDKLSREESVKMLEETVKEGDLTKIKRRISLIKVAFMKINKEEQHQKYEEFIAQGGDKSDYDTTQDVLETRFNEAFSIYKQKRKIFLEDLEKQKLENLEAKKIILEELKALIDSEESLKKTYDDFKELQDRWKAIGMVPKNEVNNLWQNYHFYVEKFFDKVKINRELRDLDLKKNLEAKLNLCEKTEDLLLETSILKSFKQLQKYHQQWKEIGPTPQDKKDEIWERFKNATDKINERRREHYEKLQENQNNNYIAKTALCEKAEEILQIELKTIKEWQEHTESITQLLKVWKTIGPAPRKQNNEIWERFKTSLDTFFANRKEFFQHIKEEQLNNYNIKLDICTQAEAIKSSTDWRNTTQEFINLQKEWKKIGPVPRKYSDKIWKRFRAACDEFFNSKSKYYANIGQHEADNLKLKEELIKKVESYEFGNDKNGNLDILKEFQREWTEIGHVPLKDKDKIQKKFRGTINTQLDKLKISKAVIQTINYKTRIEGLKDNPNAERIIYNEKNQLINKRKKIEEEINLWENNIGFLAASKKASLLKDEFDKKIENAKSEIEVLNEKIKFLEREA